MIYEIIRSYVTMSSLLLGIPSVLSSHIINVDILGEYEEREHFGSIKLGVYYSEIISGLQTPADISMQIGTKLCIQLCKINAGLN